jgi:hypothetical protein
MSLLKSYAEIALRAVIITLDWRGDVCKNYVSFCNSVCSSKCDFFSRNLAFKKILGNWKLIEYNNRGEVLDKDELTLTWNITESKLSQIRDKRDSVEYGYQVIESLKNDSHFELNFKLEDGKMNYSIASFSDSILIVCIDNKMRPNSPKERPSTTDLSDEQLKEKSVIRLKFRKIKDE